jgi:hypothetical protein
VVAGRLAWLGMPRSGVDKGRMKVFSAPKALSAPALTATRLELGAVVQEQTLTAYIPSRRSERHRDRAPSGDHSR